MAETAGNRQLVIDFTAEGDNGKKRTFKNISRKASEAQMMQFANAIEPITVNGDNPITVQKIDKTLLSDV